MEINAGKKRSCRLKTYGCSHNVSDSEYMQGVLASYGYRFTDDSAKADLWCVLGARSFHT